MIDDMIIFNIQLLDNENPTIIKLNSYIGKGNYGGVYYIGKIKNINCVIKLTKKKEEKINEYENEYHFYKKFHSNSNSNINNNNIYLSPIPRAIGIGYGLNEIDNIIYDYIIIEYVGFFSLKNILDSIINIKYTSEEELEILNNIYKILQQNLKILHKSNIILRDITPSNIVVNDIVGYYFAKKYYKLASTLNSEMGKICNCETSYEEIINFSKNNNIVQFIDLGLAFDSEIMLNNNFTKTHPYTYCIYNELKGLECLFVCTLTYMSPFCMINLSELLKINDSLICKKMVYYILLLSDIWSLNIIFLIYIHDVLITTSKYVFETRKKLIKFPIKYNYNLTSNTFSWMPFIINTNFELKDELNFENKDINYDNTKKTHNYIKNTINNILNFANFIKNETKKETKKYSIYCLEYDENTIEKIKNKITETFSNINYDIELFR